MKGFRKLVDARIAERFLEVVPEFPPKRFKDVPAVTSYVCQIGDGLWFHLAPYVDGRRLSFTTEVCWMKTNRSPIWARIGTAKDEPNDDGLRFAISHLWSLHDCRWLLAIEEFEFWDDGQVRFRPHELDEWIATHPELYPDELSEEQRLVWPLVDHMVERIVEYAIPYFQKVAGENGIEWRPQCSKD